MKSLKIFVAALILAATISPFSVANAQNLSYALNVNVGMPLGNFANCSSIDNMALLFSANRDGKQPSEAGMGVGLGIDFKVSYNLSNSLSLFGQLGVVVNNLGQSALDSIDYYHTYTMLGDANVITSPTMFSFPLLVGARYDWNLVNNFGLFAEVGLGLNFRTMTNMELKSQYPSTTPIEAETGRAMFAITDTYKAKLSTSFAFELGAGVNLTNHISLGLYYINLGSAEVKYDVERTIDYLSGDSRSLSGELTAGKVSPQMLTLRASFKF